MRLYPYLASIALIFSFCFPLIGFCKVDSETVQEIKKECKSAWMKQYKEPRDKTKFSQFGDQYCDCVVSKPLDNDAEISKAVQGCIPETIIQSAIATLPGTTNLSTATEEQLEQACQEKATDVYANPDLKRRQEIVYFCRCIAPKMKEMSASMDDKTRTAKLSSIVGTCTGYH